MLLVTDAILTLHEAANACAATAIPAAFNKEQAANGQAVVNVLSDLF